MSRRVGLGAPSAYERWIAGHSRGIGWISASVALASAALFGYLWVSADLLRALPAFPTALIFGFLPLQVRDIRRYVANYEAQQQH